MAVIYLERLKDIQVKGGGGLDFMFVPIPL